MKIMAVVNVTPDSFYDGGTHVTPDSAIKFALRCMEEGADVLDIGGESSRPGSSAVSVEEELRRVIPVVQGIRRLNATIPISIDTTKSQVVREAAIHGIQFANDITAMRGDPEMAETVARLGLNVILMHMQGHPKDMQTSPRYDNVVQELRDFFKSRVEYALHHGIAADQIWLDPGIGFGKTVEHNVALLQSLSAFNDIGCPLVVGTSRKSFIAKLSGAEDAASRLPGSLATIPAMLRANVAMVRTHDVAATRQFLSVLQAL